MAKKTASTNKGTTKVKIKKSVAGVYNLPYRPDQEVEIESKQADELIESGHAVKA